MRPHLWGALAGLALLTLSVTACTKSKPVEQAANLNLVDLSNHPPLTPIPDPDMQEGHVGRAPRRITVEQLKTSILITTGRQWSKIDTLAASMGQADYAIINAEATVPNMVFTKFLEDGAREVCLAAALTDLGKTNAEERILSPLVSPSITDLTALAESEVRANLSYLSTRFWGQALAGLELDRWTIAFRALAHATQVPPSSTAAAAPKQQAWGGICVALMTDPRFFSY